MLGKNGQIALFIVISLIILIFSMFYFFYSQNQPKDSFQKTQFDEIKNYIDVCISKTAQEGIYFISMQGGYYSHQNDSLEFGYIKVPYYFDAGKVYVPDKQTVELELSNYITRYFPGCIDNFSAFNKTGLRISDTLPVVTSSIAEKDVKISMDYQVKVESDASSAKFQKFNSFVSINLNQALDYAKKISEEQKGTNAVPLGFMARLAFKNNFTFEHIFIGNDTIIYSLALNQSPKDPLIYAFASRYNWSSNFSNREVKIKPIPEFKLTEPRILNFKVEATGENLTFYDNTDLFDINQKTGLIDFYAFDIPNGDYNIIIRAVDKSNNEAFALMKITIDYKTKFPKLEPIGNLTAYSGKEFYYKVKAADPTGKFLFFLDDTSLFNISVNTGEIKFTPLSRGNYSVKITALDDAGSDYAYFNLEVK